MNAPRKPWAEPAITVAGAVFFLLLSIYVYFPDRIPIKGGYDRLYGFPLQYGRKDWDVGDWRSFPLPCRPASYTFLLIDACIGLALGAGVGHLVARHVLKKE